MTWLKWVWRPLRWALAAVGLCCLVAGTLLAFPLSRPPELVSIHAGALAVDQSGMPNVSRFQARDGTFLAYRLYPPAGGDPQRIAILFHGSAGHSSGMNGIAKRLVADNLMVVSPDLRGHGGSGTRGDIAYDGQLDDDIQDLIAELSRQYPRARFDLLGFSLGGGFALRVATGPLAANFARLVLLAPYLGYDAPSTRSAATSARWASPDIPRITALTVLRRLGLHCCEGLPVIVYALPPGSAMHATSRYSYRLLANLSAPADLGSAFRSLKMPTTIIAGGADELMQSDKYADIVRGIEPPIEVKILPGLGHMDMLHAPAAIEAIGTAFKEE